VSSDLVPYLLIFFGLLLLFWAVPRFWLQGEDLSGFDRPAGTNLSPPGGPSAEHGAVAASLGGALKLLQGQPRSRHVAILRDYIDNLFSDQGLDATFTPVDAGGVRAEWVLAPGADAGRRTLYIHGGAFIMGSPRSHRRITSKFSEVTGGAVLSIDYRLMPEHPRMAGIEDCRTAYRWLLENGPDGPSPAAAVFVGGDSAGGNLTLSTIAWVRDAGLRKPDAAVALSPLTDATLGSPSMRDNVRTDPMLGPLFGPLAKVPRAVMLWVTWVRNRINPRDPRMSPVYGDLSNLPPVLVQASEAEMLRDDARRYVNRAAAAGSAAKLQTWNHMVHVWQIFHPDLPEGRQAFEEIGRFMTANSPAPRG
jgi:acetyl esterase/lipase